METNEIMRRMHSGEIYYENADSFKEQEKYNVLNYEYNQLAPNEHEKKRDYLERLFGEVGQDVTITQPVHANWGKNTYFGDRVYANFNLCLVDDTSIKEELYKSLALSYSDAVLDGSISKRDVVQEDEDGNKKLYFVISFAYKNTEAIKNILKLHLMEPEEFSELALNSIKDQGEVLLNPKDVELSVDDSVINSPFALDDAKAQLVYSYTNLNDFEEVDDEYEGFDTD